MKGMKKGRGSGTVMRMKQIAIALIILVAFVAPASTTPALTVEPPDATVGNPVTITGTGFNASENVTLKTIVTCWKPVVGGKCECCLKDIEIRKGVRFTLSVQKVTDNVTIYIKKGILPTWTITPGFPGFTFSYTPHTSTVSSVKVPIGGKYRIDILGDAVAGEENCTMTTTTVMELTANASGNFTLVDIDTTGIPICNFTINATGETSGSAEAQLNLSLLGDPSKDGQRNAYDCACIARYWAGISGYDNSTICYNAAAGLAPPCDQVTLEDARYLAEWLIGLQDSIPHDDCSP